MNPPKPSPFDEEQPWPCAEKLVFNTKKDADVAANVAQYQRGLKLRSYVCRYCGLWHLATDFSDE